MATDLQPVKLAPTAKYDAFVEKQLAKARGRIRTLDLAAAGLGFAILTLAFALVMVVADRALQLAPAARQVALGLYAVGALAYLAFAVLLPLLRQVNPYYAARELERTLPEAKNSVVNWLDLKEQALSPAIQTALGHKAAKDLAQADLDKALRTRRTTWLGGVALGLLGALIVLFLLGPGQLASLLKRAFAPFVEGSIATRTQLTLLKPENGHVQVPLSRPVEFAVDVRGRIPDPAKPDAVRLRYRYNPTDPYEEKPFERGESAHHWVVVMPPSQVHGGFLYKVAAGDTETDEYRVSVRTTPLVTGFDVTYRYRKYLGWADSTARDGNLQGLRGTEVTLIARTNRTIKEGQLAIDDEKPIFAERVADDPQAMRFQFVLEKDGKYKLWFTSVEGERNVDPLPYTIRVMHDQPPRVELRRPGADIELPANGLLQLDGSAADDFGVTQLTLRLRIVDGPVLKAKPYRAGKSFRFADGTFPQLLEYQDFVELDKLQTEAGQPVEVKPGLVFEYWLEAVDGCDYPEPNVGSSPVFKVTILDPDKERNPQEEKQQAQQQQKEHEQKQDQRLNQQNKERAERNQQQQPQQGENPPNAEDPPKDPNAEKQDREAQAKLDKIRQKLEQQQQGNDRGEAKNDQQQPNPGEVKQDDQNAPPNQERGDGKQEGKRDPQQQLGENKEQGRPQPQPERGDPKNQGTTGQQQQGPPQGEPKKEPTTQQQAGQEKREGNQQQAGNEAAPPKREGTNTTQQPQGQPKNEGQPEQRPNQGEVKNEGQSGGSQQPQPQGTAKTDQQRPEPRADAKGGGEPKAGAADQKSAPKQGNAQNQAATGENKPAQDQAGTGREVTKGEKKDERNGQGTAAAQNQQPNERGARSEADKLAQQMRSGDPQQRQEAEQKLKEMSQNAQDPQQRQAAKEALQREQARAQRNEKLDPQARRDLENLTKQAQSGDPQQRQDAEKKLEGMANNAPNPQTREAAKDALQQARENNAAADRKPDPQAQKNIENLAKQTQGGNAQQREEARKKLEEMARNAPDEKTRQAAQDALQKADQSAQRDAAQARKEIEKLAKQMQSGDPQQRAEAEKKLQDMANRAKDEQTRQDAANALKQARDAAQRNEKLDPQTRKELENLAKQMQSGDPKQREEAMKQLKEMAQKGKDDAARQAAADTLKQGQEEAQRAQQEQLKRDLQELARQMRSQDAKEREAAQKKLEEMARNAKDEPTRQAANEALKRAQETAQRRDKLDAQTRKELDELAKKLQSQDAKERAEAEKQLDELRKAQDQNTRQVAEDMQREAAEQNQARGLPERSAPQRIDLPEGDKPNPLHQQQASSMSLQTFQELRKKLTKEMLNDANITEEDLKRIEEMLRRQQPPTPETPETQVGPQKQGALPGQAPKRVEGAGTNTGAQRAGPALAPVEYREKQNEFTRKLSELEKVRGKK